MTKNKILVSAFDKYYATKPSSEVDLIEWFARKDKFIPIVDLIRATADKDERSRLKARLPTITPSGTFSERKADKLIAHSSIICIDIDGKDNPHILNFEELKSELVKNKHTLFCALSVSGNGLFCFIPIAFPDRHKEHFYSLQEDFKAMGIIIDKACSDVCRLRIYSYDNNSYINHDAVIYDSTLKNSLNTPERKPRVYTDRRSEPTVSNSQSNRDDLKASLLKQTQGYIQVKAESKREMVKSIITLVVEREIDITDEYIDWFKICCIIKNLFGEDGRSMFHEVSRFNPGYCFEMADRIYSSYRQGTCKYSTNNLIEIVNRYSLYDFH